MKYPKEWYRAFELGESAYDSGIPRESGKCFYSCTEESDDKDEFECWLSGWDAAERFAAYELGSDAAETIENICPYDINNKRLREQWMFGWINTTRYIANGYPTEH